LAPPALVYRAGAFVDGVAGGCVARGAACEGGKRLTRRDAECDGAETRARAG
jgi:hypothetical protein